MADLHHILKEEYTKKERTITPDSLLAMIEEVIQIPLESLNDVEIPADILTEAEKGFSVHLSLPRLTPSESWGDPNSQSRKDIDRIFASITREPSIQARIAHVNSFVDPVQAERKGRGQRFNTILNMMMIIEALQACLNDYSESSSGFVFEGFMAAITGGIQIAGRVGGTLPIEDFVTGDGEPVSLKLLSPKTPIHGSFTNLVDYLFIRGGTGVPQIKYLIGRKNSEGDDVTQLMLLDFIISRDNFVDVMVTAKNTDLLGDEGPALAAHIQAWQDSPKWRLQMYGILMRTPGYDDKRGMFSKNLDAEGTFDPAAGKPRDPALKQADYKKELGRTIKIRAKKQGFADANAGQEPDFESWVSNTPEAQDAEQKTIKALRKAYDQGHSEAQPQQVAESYFGEFHEREKMLMEEYGQLMEAVDTTGGKQWAISSAATEKIANIANVEIYGELNMSNENIKACADIYIAKLGENLTTLLKTTEKFTKNIGKYFSADRRSTAMNANQKAQTEGQEVVDLLAKDVSSPESEDDI
jgi:hypothetical protein